MFETKDSNMFFNVRTSIILRGEGRGGEGEALGNSWKPMFSHILVGITCTKV